MGLGIQGLDVILINTSLQSGERADSAPPNCFNSLSVDKNKPWKRFRTSRADTGTHLKMWVSGVWTFELTFNNATEDNRVAVSYR